MRIINILVVVILTNVITACSSLSGNVVPTKGPTMEQVYDGMGKHSRHASSLSAGKQKIDRHRLSERDQPLPFDRQFRKVENPELAMYVFPHLATKNNVPVPGYGTVFSAYTEDHYTVHTSHLRS